MTGRGRLRGLALAGSVMVAAGCSPSPGAPSVSTTSIADRPDLSSADPRYRSLLEEGEKVLRDVAGVTPSDAAWDIDGGGCPGTDPALGYVTRDYRRAGTYAAVPEPRWAAVVGAFEAFLTPKGYSRKQVLRDGPGAHEVRWFDAAGASVGLGSEKRTVLHVWSACHRAPSTSSASTS